MKYSEDESILPDVHTAVYGIASRDYAHPSVNLDRIAQLWSVVLDTDISPRQVCQCMILLKVARDMETPKRDNLVDIAGYAEIAQLVK